MTNSNKVILIKRYASRRLYNTEISDYVTLEQVAQYIRDGDNVKIIDRKTGDELTRQYLMQIITEYESKGENVLPISVLTDIVRSYNDQSQNFIPDFLSQSYDMLKQQQETMLSNIQNKMPENLQPLSAIPPIQGLEQWQKMQSDFLGNMMSPWLNDETEEQQTSENTEQNQEQNHEPVSEKKPEPVKPKPTSKKKTSSATKSRKVKTTKKKESATKTDEIDEIKKQLFELQSKLKDL